MEPKDYKEVIDGIERMVVSGITSYGEGCGLTGKPGYFYQ